MKKRIGVASITKRAEAAKQLDNLGKSLEDTKIAVVKENMNNFKKSLETFALKYRDKINSDPEFRMQFHRMCISVGVDPLASNKGFWADVLGMGKFYFDLSVTVVQISLQTRHENGGIMLLTDLLKRIRNSNMKRQSVSLEDIYRAVDKLSILGNGFKIVEVSGKQMLISIPLELNYDQQTLFSEAQDNGFISLQMLISLHGWSHERFKIALEPLLHDGMIWIDSYNNEINYYFPSLINQ